MSENKFSVAKKFDNPEGNPGGVHIGGPTILRGDNAEMPQIDARPIPEKLADPNRKDELLVSAEGYAQEAKQKAGGLPIDTVRNHMIVRDNTTTGTKPTAPLGGDVVVYDGKETRKMIVANDPNAIVVV